MTDAIDHAADWLPLRSALTVATYDVGITPPRPLLMRLYEATVDELVDCGFRGAAW